MKAERDKQQAIEIVKFIYKVQLLGLLSYFLVIPLDSGEIVHAIILSGAFLSLLIVAFGISIIPISPKKVVIFFSVVFIMLISMLFHIESIDDNLIYSCFCFLSLCLMLEMSRSIALDRKTQNYMCAVFTAIALLISVYAQFPFAYMRKNGSICPYLTLNLGNANYAGMMILCTLLVLGSITPNYRIKVPFWIIETYLIYLIFKTGARSCFVAVIVYILAAVFLRHRKIPNWLSAIMVMVPVIWVPIYLILYRVSSNSIMVLGKSFFTGRENVYIGFLRLINDPVKILFGNLTEAGLQNAHNAPLAVICSIGLVGAALFYWLICSLLYHSKQVQYNTQRNIALFAVWGILVGSSFEASLFLGGFPGVVFVFTVFVLLGWNNQDLSAHGGHK